jgi:hypothetical protein
VEPRDGAGEGPLDFGSGAGEAEPPERAEPRAGDGPPPERWAHREDPDLARVTGGRAAPPGGGPARMAPGASRYGWFVGIVAVLALGYVTINTLRSNGPGSRGVAVGRPAPPFAAPLATSDLQGDVNFATGRGGGDAGSVPACSVHGPRVLNLCDLYARRPVVLAFFAAPGKACVRELDVLDRVGAAHPDVAFAAVALGARERSGERDRVRRLVRAHRWRLPVAYDADGVLANLYGVAVCPQISYLRRGGRVAGTSLGELGAAGVTARVVALERHEALPG